MADYSCTTGGYAARNWQLAQRPIRYERESQWGELGPGLGGERQHRSFGLERRQIARGHIALDEVKSENILIGALALGSGAG
jgi:hypothetical protein